jgi:serine/threonine protein kinase
MSGATGTVRYMAPEVYLSRSYNEKVDVYSFAIVLWEMVARRQPFCGMNSEDFKNEVVLGGLRPELDPNWPPCLIDLLNSCWDPDPNSRPEFNSDWLG